MPTLYSLPRPHLIRLSNAIRDLLSKTPYKPREGESLTIKSIVESLLPESHSNELHKDIANFLLCCAALASAEGDDSPSVYWIPKDLSAAAKSAFQEVSEAVCFSKEHELVAELMPDVLPVLKGVIRESCVDTSEEAEFIAASAKAPVANAVVAAHQFRWLVSQVSYPYLGKLCPLVVPCALTALDHWSPEVKEQGMVIFIHLAKNVTAAELGWYEEAILDACCRNIASSDELWYRVVEMSVLLLTCTQRMNPRSSWFERMLSEMLSHLERQPLNKERRIVWLQLIEPVFDVMGLVILAHFRRIFPLFIQWLHADDDKTLLLVMDRLHTIIKLTWMRKSPYIEKLVDELMLLYKEAATRKNREVIRTRIIEMLKFLQKCKGQQFETAWEKHKNDHDLSMLTSSFGDQTH